MAASPSQVANEESIPGGADRLDDIPLPWQHPYLVGHDRVLNDFCQQYASGRLHHAFLITGPRGVGKASLAFRLAWHLFANPNWAEAPGFYTPPQADDVEFSRVSRGGHGNLLLLSRPYNAQTKRYASRLTVDEVRRTVGFFGTTSAERAMRVCIVDAADDMNPNAANALLKVLEEPPNACCFFLISHSSGKLLPTIRSRCQTLRLNPLENEDMLGMLNQFGVMEKARGEGISEEDLALTARLAGGSLRRVINLLENDGLGIYRSICRLGFDATSADWPEIHKLANMLASRANEEKYNQFVDLVLEETSRRIHMQAGEESLPISALARWPDVWEKVEQITATSHEYNLDRKQVILSIFQMLVS